MQVKPRPARVCSPQQGCGATRPRAGHARSEHTAVSAQTQTFSKYLREKEAQRHHPNLSIALPVIRPQLVDWLFQTCRYFRFTPQTAYQVLQLADLYATQLLVTSEDLGLLFLTCLFCVAKYDALSIKVKDVENLCNKKYGKKAILAMEWDLLQTLDYKVDGPTVLDFLNLLWEVSEFDPFRADEPNNPVIEASMQFVQVMALDPLFAVLPPSLVAAAAFFLARDFCHFSILWESKFQRCLGIKREEVRSASIEFLRKMQWCFDASAPWTHYVSARGFVQMVAFHQHSPRSSIPSRSKTFKRACYWDCRDYACL